MKGIIIYMFAAAAFLAGCAGREDNRMQVCLRGDATGSIAVAGKLLVDLTASDLSLGTLRTWTNGGTLGGSFGNDGTSPTVEVVDGHKAVTFDGSDRMIATFTAPAAITGSSDWSVEIWAYNPSIPLEEAIVQWAARGGPPGTTAHLGYGSDEKWGAIVHWTPRFDMGFDGGVPSAGNWHHIVATYEGGSNGTETIYVDGVPNATENKTLSIRTGDAVYLGISWYWTLTRFRFAFTGSLAEVRIHDGALDADDVLKNFNAGID